MHSRASLDDAEDSLFYTYWSKVKNKISDMQNLPYSILRQIAAVKGIQDKTKDKAGRVRDWVTYNKSYDSLKRLNAMLPSSIDVKNKIDKWLPTWTKKYEGEKSSPPQLGFLQYVIIGTVAMAALAFVAVKGLSLLKEYELEKRTIESVEAGRISLEQAKEIVGAAKPVGITEGLTRGITAGVSSALTPILLVGGALVLGYFAFAGQIRKRFT